MNISLRCVLLSILISTSTSFANQLFLQNNDRKLNISLDKFLAISCDTTGTLCIASGFSKSTEKNDRLVYRSQDAGITWSSPISLSESPEETTMKTNQRMDNIRCDTSGQRCVIVSTAMVNKIPTPIVYNTEDGGLTWSEPTLLKLPVSINKKHLYTLTTHLSCDHFGLSCIIAGTLGDQSGGLSPHLAHPLLYKTEDVTTHRWSLLATLPSIPNVVSHLQTLNSISCDNTGMFCVAVGDTVIADGWFSRSHKLVIYTTADGAAHWNKPLLLSEASKEGISIPLKVVCNDTGMQCTIMGATINPSTFLYRNFSLTTMNRGLEWEKQNFITPSYSDELLLSLDCDGTGINCMAVGGYNAAKKNGFYKPLSYMTTDNAEHWEINTNNTYPLSPSFFTDIFCSKTGDHCVAVGVQKALTTALLTHNMMSLYEKKLEIEQTLGHNQDLQSPS